MVTPGYIGCREMACRKTNQGIAYVRNTERGCKRIVGESTEANDLSHILSLFSVTHCEVRLLTQVFIFSCWVVLSARYVTMVSYRDVKHEHKNKLRIFHVIYDRNTETIQPANFT